MKGFDVLKVKSAVKNHNKFDLSRTHLTTMDFGQIVPLMVEETVPGDKFSVGAEYFSRMAPLVKPTFGKFDFRTVCAFVPYHQVAVDADAWFAGKTVWEGMTPRNRYINLDNLDAFIRSYCCTSAGVTDDNVDYVYVASTGTVQKLRFTTQGKYWVKILNALGYACPQGVDGQSASTWTTVTRATKLSAFPLLAFFKLYNDYMSQSQRFNTSQLSSFLNAVKYAHATSGYNVSTGEIQYTGMKILFDNLFLNYDNDYFTSAWQSANNPLSSPDTINAGAVPANGQSASVSTLVQDTVLIQNGGSTLTLGQRALDFLRDFDNWVRRNNYSGSRAVQQIFSRFGIKTDDYKSHYAQVVKTDKMPIQVGDVTATADAQNVPLGDYAGKAIMNGQNGFNIDVSDYGLVIVLGYFTVVPMNSFGYDRRVLRNTPLDYYNPEFDGLGADAISVGELFANPTSSASTVQDTAVFGFTERYNAYRYGRDVITGEFRNYHANADMNTWHTGRNLTAIRDAGALVAQSTSMNTLPQTDSEYNRIFSVTSGDVDHFYLTCRFKVDAIRPMLNLNQVTNLGEGDTLVPRNGNVIS